MTGPPVGLTQVSSNLLTNAARHTGNEGNVGVIASRENEEHPRIRVPGNGAGIAEEVLPVPRIVSLRNGSPGRECASPGDGRMRRPCGWRGQVVHMTQATLT